MATLYITVYTPQKTFEHLKVNPDSSTREECERARDTFKKHGLSYLIGYSVDAIGNEVEFSFSEGALNLSVIEWTIED
jgi:hypothetical protein